MRNFIKKTHLFIILLTLIGVLLHFTNLNWGSPYYFHPDERNIASSISQLKFPQHMNPQFFAYGSLPIYTVYFTGVLINIISHWGTTAQIITVPFEKAIIILRVYSALFATFLIPILFVIGRKLKDTRTGYISAFLATASVGMTQFAHFGTFEMWLTFFSVLLFWTTIEFMKEKKIATLLVMGGIFGVLMATKVSSLALFPLLFLLLLMSSDRSKHAQDKVPLRDHMKSILHNFSLFLAQLFLLCGVAFLVYFLSNPYVVLDNKSFLSSMNYESGVALGSLPVFYSGEFYDTTPIVYQFISIYPFVLNPLLTILFIPALLFIFYIGFHKKRTVWMALVAFFLILFLSQVVLFVKWTRYMTPTLPFIYLCIALAIGCIRSKFFQIVSLTIVVITCSVFTYSYFATAFLRPDTRITALEYAQKNIPRNAKILSETYDLGITPFNMAFFQISLFNFYDLDSNSPDYNPTTLKEAVDGADYIILPSQRVLQPRLQNPARFPNGQKFYKALLDGSLGYEKIYQSPCDIFCQIIYLGNPTFSFEQTASVFDRPTVYIFKKI